MLEKIKNKLLEIEAKTSNAEAISLIKSTEEKINTGRIPRHSKLVADNTTFPMFFLYQELNELNTAIADLDKLSSAFYNLKEAQMLSIGDKLGSINLKKKVLYSFESGTQIANILLSEKKSLQLTNNFFAGATGITFPLISKVLQVPKKVTVVRDSNIRLGSIEDPTKNSRTSAIFTTDQNDLLSIHRTDNVDLYFKINIEFGKELILNYMELEYIKKTGQDVEIIVRNTDSGEVIYLGNGNETAIFLEKPFLVKEIAVLVKVKAIDINQFDFKELNFYTQEYKQELMAETIAMPIFGNKFLTLENVVYKHDSYSNFFDTKVFVGSDMLHSSKSEERITGPYRDPVFKINTKTIITEKILNYLGDIKYRRKSQIDPNDDFKACAFVVDENKVQATQDLENNNESFFALPFPNMENYIDVYVNGRQMFRAFESETLTSKKYKVYYNGFGYYFTFLDLPLNSKIEFQVTGSGSWIDKGNLYIPNLALASDVSINYAKKLAKRKIPIVLDDRKTINLGQGNVQRVLVFNLDGIQLSTLTEVDLGAVSAGEYCVDYNNGIVSFGASINGFIEILYFESETISLPVETAEKNIKINSDIQVFEFRDNISNLINKEIKAGTSELLGYQKYTKSFITSSIDAGIVKVPNYLTLHKGSVRLYSSTSAKKEVEFIDGISEFETNTFEYGYFDYLRTYNTGTLQYHEYGLRGSGVSNFDLGIGALLSEVKFIFEDSFLINQKFVNPIAPLVLNTTLTLPGDYCLNTGSNTIEALKGNRLYVYNPEFPEVPVKTVRVKIIKAESANSFSVDYKSNTIYGQSLSGQTLGFNYSCIDFHNFNLGLEINKTENLRPNEYFAVAYNKQQLQSLIKYFTPVIEFLSVGVIG